MSAPKPAGEPHLKVLITEDDQVNFYVRRPDEMFAQVTVPPDEAERIGCSFIRAAAIARLHAEFRESRRKAEAAAAGPVKPDTLH